MSFDPPPLPARFSQDQFQVWWQAVLASLKAELGALAAAQAALAAAVAAQSTADTVKRTDKISGSSVVPANVLSASDAGSNASVTVAAHTRVYGDGSQLSVGGHTFTGKSYSTKYAVYYNDATTSDTTPTYQITTTLSNAVANFATGRHFVGTITTPAAAAGPTSGGTSAPGTDPADRPDFGTL